MTEETAAVLAGALAGVLVVGLVAALAGIVRHLRRPV